MLYLKNNLPRWERASRVALGLGAAAATWAWAPAGMLALAGWGTAATLVLTGFVGFCPACAMVGRRPVEATRP